MQRLLYFLLLAFPCITFAQTDEINISAAFSNFIDLRIQGASSVEWQVTTIKQYQEGFWPASNKVTFQVASSNSFSVDMAFTPMSDGAGNELDIRNIVTRLEVDRPKAESEEGVRWGFGSNDSGNNGYEPNFRVTGEIFGSTTAKTIIVPGPSGNAGTYEDNEFTLRIGLGRIEFLQRIGMPSMLDQNITPGTYTGTITLTAIPEAL